MATHPVFFERRIEQFVLGGHLVFELGVVVAFRHQQVALRLDLPLVVSDVIAHLIILQHTDTTVW